MGVLDRTSFAQGWMPDADAAAGPADALLRADNLVLDERGLIALRKGSALVDSVGGDAHSLFTAILEGTRYRYVGSGNDVYVNGNSLVTGLAGAGDVAFGSHLGQVLFARGTSKQKHDGATLRTWGITMTGDVPTAAAVAPDSKTFATCDSGEAPGFTWDEDSGVGAGYTTGADGAANGALVLVPDPTSGRGTVTRRFVGVTDFTDYGSGTGQGTDDDIISFYAYLVNPADVQSIVLMVDVNGGSAHEFQDDYYVHEFLQGVNESINQNDPLQGNFSVTGPARGVVDNRVHPNSTTVGLAISRFRPEQPGGSGGTPAWTKLFVRRGDMLRVGVTTGKNWTTVSGVRVIVRTLRGSEVDLDTIVITSGAQQTPAKWRYIYVNDTGTYVARSAPSALSAEVLINAKGATITVPADASRDTQVNAVWLYRMDGPLDDFYRVATAAVTGAGAVTVHDTFSDVDALSAGLHLEDDNTVPPDNIIGMDGPYYDRTIVLTSDGLVCPSRRLDPDAFAIGQQITVAGDDETPYWIKKTFSGLLIGTSKDVYRLVGDGAELPDGTINFTLEPLNIDHPPISAAVATEGNELLYCASDGWRALNGASSTSIVAWTSLLYRGSTRHGVLPVNLTGGRLRAAIAHGQFVAITPEGGHDTSSPVIYRHAPANGVTVWYRHVYPHNLRVVYREPDGTLLAGDDTGNVWTLDVASGDDGGDAIPVTLWTKQDDNGNALGRKDPIDLRLELQTGAATGTVAIHLDGSEAPAYSPTVQQSGLGVVGLSLASVDNFRRVQLRLTVTTTDFHFAGFGLPYGDIPVPWRGQLPPSNFGDPRLKTFSGFQFRVCTLGAPRVLTPTIDGIAQPPLSVLSSLNEPIDATLAFAAPVPGIEVVLASDGDIELYAWSPLITFRRPLGVQAYDTGPIIVGDKDLVWVRQVRLKVNAGADLSLTVYLDGRKFGPSTGVVSPNVDTIVPIDLGRGYQGRVAQLVVESSAPFYPYYLEVVRRTSGLGTAKGTQRYPLTLEMGAAS